MSPSEQVGQSTGTADRADTSSAACRRDIGEPYSAEQPDSGVPRDAAEFEDGIGLGIDELCRGDERPAFRVDFKAPTTDELEAALLELSLVLDELLLVLDENAPPIGDLSNDLRRDSEIGESNPITTSRA